MKDQSKLVLRLPPLGDEQGLIDQMKNKSVLEMKISDEVKGRRKTMSKIPVEIVDRIYEAAQKGLVIDFSEMYRYGGEVGVRLYIVNGKYMNYDTVHDEMDRQWKRNKEACITGKYV